MVRPLVLGGIALASLLGVASCNAIFGVSDLEFAPPSTTSAGGAEGGGPATGGHGGAPGPGGGGPGGVAVGGLAGAGGVSDGGGGQGGAPPLLVDRELLVRYYFDEAEDGELPTAALDHAKAPAFDLSLTYDGGVQYSSEATGRSLRFPASHSGMAARSITGSKIRSELDTSTEATIELVVAVEMSMAATSILFMVMEPGSNDGRFGLAVTNDSDIYLELNQQTPGLNDASQYWRANIAGSGRRVVQLVLDTKLADVGDRTKLFLDGVLLSIDTMPPLAVTPPALNEGVDTCEMCQLIIGNRQQGDRDLHGAMFYAALYKAALTDTELAINRSVLTTNDDAPP